MNTRIDSAEQAHCCIVGGDDFIRRMNAARNSERFALSKRIVVSTGTILEARVLLVEQRPDILVVDMGYNISKKEAAWRKRLLAEIRERFGKKLFIIVALSDPKTFLYGGDLLFVDDKSLEPSGLVDSLIITPPPGIPGQFSLEQQFCDSLNCASEIMLNPQNEGNPLPCLWDADWAPTLCAPSSRDVWMRWLPRYAKYINESPLIIGPTGSGKTRLAAALHRLSGRGGPFVSITPRDFSSTELVQAELFGAVAGAYTGAVDKWGLVKRAEGGTLFIDELQSIDFDLQGKLITFIENKSYRRVGEAESHQANVRFIFASNRPLQELIDEGKLRDDFAYRLERLRLELKPLSDRRLDISAGICFALAKVLRERKAEIIDEQAFEVTGFDDSAYRKLYCTSWPGNLRQLENSVAKLIESCSFKGATVVDGDTAQESLTDMLGRKDLTSTDIYIEASQRIEEIALSKSFDSIADFGAALMYYAREIALERSGGSVAKAAKLLKDSEANLGLLGSFSGIRETLSLTTGGSQNE
jgi:transcriptional regulator with AAA-type ATPase domain